MIIKTIRDEDYSSYKGVSMMIAFPRCSFKCCTEAKRSVAMCQNSPIAKLPDINISPEMIADRYERNVITHSVVCGGLEPLDSFQDLLSLISEFRVCRHIDDLFVIYTGYNEDEVELKTALLSRYGNIIVKYGRYIPSSPSHYDDLLGVVLASPNQYAKRIS